MLGEPDLGVRHDYRIVGTEMHVGEIGDAGNAAITTAARASSLLSYRQIRSKRALSVVSSSYWVRPDWAEAAGRS